MPSWDSAEIRRILGSSVDVRGASNTRFDNVKPIHEADASSLVWVNPRRADRQELLDGARAAFVIAPRDLDPTKAVANGACVVLSDNPKLAFIRVVRECFVRANGPKAGIHRLANVSADAKVDPTAVVEAFATVGNATIGANVIVRQGAFIGDGVTVGRNVIIGPGATVGVDGFGYTPNETGEWEHFPHLGGVVLGDDVAIGASACIVRGTLGDTVIGNGSKIDNLVSVGHNSTIGRRTLVAANSVIGGSATIGDDVWVSPLAIVMNRIKVGNKVVVGAGVVVARDVEDGATLIGSPPKALPRGLQRRTPLA